MLKCVGCFNGKTRFNWLPNELKLWTVFCVLLTSCYIDYLKPPAVDGKLVGVVCRFAVSTAIGYPQCGNIFKQFKFSHIYKSQVINALLSGFSQITQAIDNKCIIYISIWAVTWLFIIALPKNEAHKKSIMFDKIYLY